MNFEKQKQEIIDFISNYTGGYARDELTKKINELKPDYPTCNSCKYYSKYSFYCNNPKVIENPADDDFGCNRHSGLELAIVTFIRN